jgi:hypothetical protein
MNYKKNVKAIHTNAVASTLAKREPNYVHGVPAPDVHPSDGTLPRPICTTMRQMRSGHCSALQTYKHKLNSAVLSCPLTCLVRGVTRLLTLWCTSSPVRQHRPSSSRLTCGSGPPKWQSFSLAPTFLSPPPFGPFPHPTPARASSSGGPGSVDAQTLFLWGVPACELTHLANNNNNDGAGGSGGGGGCSGCSGGGLESLSKNRR